MCTTLSRDYSILHTHTQEPRKVRQLERDRRHSPRAGMGPLVYPQSLPAECQAYVSPTCLFHQNHGQCVWIHTNQYRLYAPKMLFKSLKVQLLWAYIFRNTCEPDEMKTFLGPFQLASILLEAPSHSVAGGISPLWSPASYPGMGLFVTSSSLPRLLTRFVVHSCDWANRQWSQVPAPSCHAVELGMKDLGVNHKKSFLMGVYGSEWVAPSCASAVCGLFWAEDNFSPFKLQGNFCPFLNHLEELELGPCPY